MILKTIIFAFFLLVHYSEVEQAVAIPAEDTSVAVEEVTATSAQAQEAGVRESTLPPSLPYVRKGEIIYPIAFLDALDGVEQDPGLPDSIRAYGPIYPYRDSTHLLVTGDFDGDGVEDAAVQDVEGERIIVAHGSVEGIASVHILEANGFFSGLGAVRRRRLLVSGMYDSRSGAEVRATYAGLELKGHPTTGVGGEPDTLWYVSVPDEATLLYGVIEGDGTPHFVWDGMRYRLVMLPHA